MNCTYAKLILNDTVFWTEYGHAGWFLIDVNHIMDIQNYFFWKKCLSYFSTLFCLTGSTLNTRDCYSRFAATVLGRLYERGREVAIFSSHSPGDLNFCQDLMESVIGDWIVKIQDREHHFWLTYANSFDKLVGNLMKNLLTENGQHYQRTEISSGWSLVIDIGGVWPIIWRSTLAVKWTTTWLTSISLITKPRCPTLGKSNALIFDKAIMFIRDPWDNSLIYVYLFVKPTNHTRQL